MNWTRDIFSQAKAIYNNCADELSKVIYMDKVLYAMSGDERYTYKLIEDSLTNLFTSGGVDAIKRFNKVVIYGAGYNLDIVFGFCQKNNIQISYICDKDENKQGKEYKNIEIISPDNLVKNHMDAVIIISTTLYLAEVKAFLRLYFKEEQIIPFVDEKHIEYMKLQYFDEVVKLEDGEIFVDGGCFDFETSELLLDRCRAEKIYAFEPDSINLKKVQDKVNKMGISNVEIIHAGMWDCNTVLHFNTQGSIMSRVDENGENEIEVVAIDEVIDGKVTFIKMDIEGSELKALHGAEQKIKKYKPNLAICIYHKVEDIIDIPTYIHSLVPEYKFYIRHYSLGQAETVLYAIV